jgi:DNA repair protein RadA/Sms
MVYTFDMPRFSTQYVCQQCGYQSPKWVGQCPECSTWNSMVETVVQTGKAGRSSKTSSATRGGYSGIQSSEPIKLSKIQKAEYGKRVSSGIEELDRVLGGGIVSGMVTLIAGEPGIGKSTLLLQIADKIKGRVIYVAGEESASQIANRASRLGVKGEGVEVIENTDVDSVVTSLENNKETSTSLVIVDSIQTMTTSDLTGTAGSVGQVRECAARLTAFAKRTGTPIFLVGHVTREGTIAGPRVLEHMVDTVLWFEGERREFLRIIRGIKNRFGPTDEVGIFSMEEKGLVPTDPSKMMIDHTGSVSGSCLAVLIEGTRPLVVEIQALVAPTKLAFPKRSASGVDSRRLELIVAVLSRRVGLPLWEYDIYVNVAGGIRVQDPASDLAIALAIASSFKEIPVKGKLAAVGEIGLLGEIREVIQLARRLKEAERLGFKPVVSSKLIKTVAEAVHKFVTK